VGERQRLTTGVDGFVNRAVALAAAGIVTKTDADEAGLLIRAARARQRAIAEHYSNIRAGVRKSIEHYKVMEQEDSAPCVQINTLLAGGLQAWILEQRTLAAAANRDSLTEAEARARAEQARQAEALRNAASAAPTARDRKVLETQARAVERAPVLPIVVGAVEAPTIEGISVPTRKAGEVTDVKLLMRAVLAGKVPEAVFTVNQTWLDKQATDRGKDLNFPGVVVREKPTLSARGA
jgi:hypothetical protein